LQDFYATKAAGECLQVSPTLDRQKQRTFMRGLSKQLKTADFYGSNLFAVVALFDHFK